MTVMSFQFTAVQDSCICCSCQALECSVAFLVRASHRFVRSCCKPSGPESALATIIFPPEPKRRGFVLALSQISFICEDAMACSWLAEATRPALRDHWVRLIRSMASLSQEEQEAHVDHALSLVENHDAIWDFQHVLSSTMQCVEEDAQLVIDDTTVLVVAPAGSQPTAEDGEDDDAYFEDYDWISFVTKANIKENDVGNWVKRNKDNHFLSSDEIAVFSAALQELQDAALSISQHGKWSPYAILHCQIETLAHLEIKLKDIQARLQKKYGKEECKPYDENVLFPIRDAFMYRCAAIYMLRNGDPLDITSFTTFTMKPIYENLFGPGSKESTNRLAQLQQALAKLKVFPHMKSNNAKENARKGKPRPPRQNKPKKSDNDDRQETKDVDHDAEDDAEEHELYAEPEEALEAWQHWESGRRVFQG